MGIINGLFGWGTKEKKTKTYLVYTVCDNCNSEDATEIPYGVIADEFLKNTPCDYCGCKDKLNMSEGDD